MNLDLSKFRKIHEDHKSARLKNNEGHEIVIAKHVLSPKLRSKIAELPMHLAGGGEAETNEDLEREARGLPKKANLMEEAQRSAGGYPADFPEPHKVGQQAPIVINVGQPQQPAQPSWGHDKSSGTLPMSNGTVDWNKYTVNAPDAPLDSKVSAMKNLQAEEENKKAFEQADVQKKQFEAQEAAAYNRVAAERGLPSIPVPGAPAMQNQIMPASVSQPLPQPQLEAQPQNQDPYGMNAYYGAAQQGIGEQERGIQQEAQAQGEMGKAQAEALGQGIAEKQQALNQYQTHFDALNKEYESFRDDIQKQHIDPKHYLNSMGAGQKISTAIGLILGGMGGGLMHQENPALKFLQNQIDNDIRAQQMELGKKENLLTANYRQFGNLRDATEMTRAMLTGIVGDKLQSAAAQATDPIAKARALQASGKLHTEVAAPLISQIAMRKAMMGSMQSQQGGNDQTAQFINMLRMSNPELAKNYEGRFIPNVGLAQVPIPEKPREEITSRQNLDAAIADLRKFSDEHAGTVLDRAIVNEGAAKANLVQDAYRRANAQGVFREAEAKFVQGIVDQDPTKFFSSWRVDPKYRALEEDNMRQLNGLKKSFGLPTPYKPPSAKPYVPQAKK